MNDHNCDELGDEPLGHCPVTPTLFVGRGPHYCTSVDTADAAIRVIADGGDALLPYGEWAAAEAVVRHFSTPEWAAERVRLARADEDRRRAHGKGR